MAEPQRELAQRIARGAALEQQEKAGGETSAVGAGFAVEQRRGPHGAVDLVQAQDPVALRRAAAFQGHVDEVQA